jgi:pimeloyl-ACP methyl ester carboxylesterase
MLGALMLLSRHRAFADLSPHDTVIGSNVTDVEVGAGSYARDAKGALFAWMSLGTTDVAPGARWLAFTAPAGADAVLIPVCAGRKRVHVGEQVTPETPGPRIVGLPRNGQEHRVVVELDIGSYEHRVACGGAPRVGVRGQTSEGLHTLAFDSPHRASGGGQAVIYVPHGHDKTMRSTLLVGLHPWNGTPWTYAAYGSLLDAADSQDVVLLFPSGLGNSLYTAPAEDEVLRAIDAAQAKMPIDPDRITLWGASMGGAGATTIGFHHPDRFAEVISLFGDSKYDLSTYVKGILHDETGAHLVNAVDIVDNARNVPVWLVHGEDDHVSPLRQSAVLDRALRAMGFAVTFDRVPHAGHEGRVVSAFAERIVEAAAHARRVSAPSRVSYWSVRPNDTESYGIRMTRTGLEGDSFFDVERQGDAVHLRRAEGVRAIRLPRGAFGAAPTRALPVVVDDRSAASVEVSWDPLP